MYVFCLFVCLLACLFVCLLACLFVCLLACFLVLNSENIFIFSANVTTLDTRREEIDIEMKQDVAHEYDVPVSMMKITKCEEYAPPPIKP